MNVDAIISAVYSKPPIWDKWSKSHSNRNIVEKCWKEISKELDIEVNILRKKWKYLRDQFSVELGKVPPSRSGDGATNYTCKWPHFKSLLFLKDTVKARTSKGNCSNTANTNDAINETLNSGDGNEAFDGEDERSDEEESDEMGQIASQNDSQSHESQPLSPSELSTPVPSPSSSTVSSKRKRSATEIWNAAMINIEKQKLKYLQQKSESKKEAEDEDLLFFKSLLTHTYKIAPERKLEFRSRIQDIVNQYAYGITFSSSTQSYNSGASSHNVLSNPSIDMLHTVYPNPLQSSHNLDVQVQSDNSFLNL